MKQWEDLKASINRHFKGFDFVALQAAYAAAFAHTDLEEAPVWLMVTGCSSSGKTTIIVDCCLATLAHNRVLSQLNRNSFISGLRKDLGGASVLHELSPLPEGDGTHGILIFKDFTSILSLRPEEQRELLAQMREVYDGHFAPAKGTYVKPWEGKVTAIAVATGEVEAALDFQGAMGPRWVSIRMPRGDGEEAARSALAQGPLRTVVREVRKVATEFANCDRHWSSQVEVPDWLPAVCELTAISRRQVKRNYRGKIYGLGEAEQTPRMAIVSRRLAQGYKKAFGGDGWWLVRRILRDSIPLERRLVLDADGGFLCDVPGPAVLLHNTIEDLDALGLASERDGVIMVSDQVRGLIERGTG